MDAFRDGLEHFDVNGRGRAVVPIVLEFVIAGDAPRMLEACEGESHLDGDAWDDRTDVEGEDGRVHVHVVRVEDRGVLNWGKDGTWEP